MNPHSDKELSIGADWSPFATAANTWPPRDPDDEDFDEEDEEDENDNGDESPVVREPDED